MAEPTSDLVEVRNTKLHGKNGPTAVQSREHFENVLKANGFDIVDDSPAVPATGSARKDG